jgi:1L-myo-inositol 1-phosphate cytidylyltransferase
MQAVVLAAGMGTRLRSASPIKPLTEVAGRALILHTLDRLAQGGATSALVITGYEGAAVRSAVEAAETLPITFIHNPAWQSPNGVSLLAAGAALEAQALLCMADHLVAPALYAAMISHRLGDDALALGIDRRLGHAWVDEDDVTRVATRHDRIIGIGKCLPIYDCYDSGVFLITPDLTRELAAHARPGLSDGIRGLAARGRCGTVDISSHDWLDIDDPRALALAESWIGG